MSNKDNDYTEEVLDKLTVSKKVSTDLSYQLQLLNQRVMSCIESVDSTEIEDVISCNNIINLLNALITQISDYQQTELKLIDLIMLTDETGNIANEYKQLVVGYYFLEGSQEKFYKCRIVNARTFKEAISKYKKEYQSIDLDITCFGEYNSELEYSKILESDKIID